MENSDYEIIKDPKDKNLFYIAIQNNYDADEERTIIGFGKTENEALKDALRNALKTLSTCENTLHDVQSRIGNDCLIDDKFTLESRKIPIKQDFGEAKYFDSLFWMEEEKIWGRFYR